MIKKLPQHWTKSTIGELSDQINGKPFKQNEWRRAGVPIIRIQNLNNALADFNYADNEIEERFMVTNGDLLFAWSGTPGTSFGAHIWNRGEACLNQHIFNIKIKTDLLDKRFYYYALRVLVGEFILGAQGTAGLAHITKKKFEETQVPLPPLLEQKRIVAKLDKLFAHLGQLKARLEKIPELLTQFRQAMLTQAYEGKLTEDWAKENEYTSVQALLKTIKPIPKPNRYNSRTSAVTPGKTAISVGLPNLQIPGRFQWVELVSIARLETGHTPSRKHPEYWDNGDVNWIGIRDAGENHSKTITDTYQKTNALGLANSAARLLPEGTVCLSRTASVGYVVKMGKSMATSQDFVNWVCSAAINPDWLKWLLVAETESIWGFGKGTTHTTVYFPEVISFHVALAPIEEQKQIVTRIESLFAHADRIEVGYKALTEKIEQLPQAILTRAFHGGLVNDHDSIEEIQALEAGVNNALREFHRN